MGFSFNISLIEAKIIKAERIYLELLTSEQDYEKLLELEKKNLKDDYIKSLYAERPEDIDFGHISHQVSAKFSRNCRLKDDEKDFYKLYYVIKLASGEIIGTFEMFSCYSGIEFALFIDQDHGHQYYGTEALNTVIDFLKKNSTVSKVKWECNADNKGSVGVAKKCGFVHFKDWVVYDERMASTFYLTIDRNNNTEPEQKIPTIQEEKKYITENSFVPADNLLTILKDMAGGSLPEEFTVELEF